MPLQTSFIHHHVQKGISFEITEYEFGPYAYQGKQLVIKLLSKDQDLLSLFSFLEQPQVETNL